MPSIQDSGLGSDVTIAPSESASQAPKHGQGSTAKSTTGRAPKRSAKSGVDKDAPPGAVQVPPPAQNSTGKKSPVVSTTIPLSGWGEIDLVPFRKDIRPEFTIDAGPFIDLVDTTYGLIFSRYSQAGKHIPFALFRYYCMLLWWHRVIFLYKGNANTLTTEEKQLHNVLSAGEEFQVPSSIAQYLASMGNFTQGSENFYFSKLKISFTGKAAGAFVEEGWVKTSDVDGLRVTNTDEFWAYAQLPVPAVFVLMVQNEANSTLPAPLARNTLDHIAPLVNSRTFMPTRNIVGWRNEDYMATHSSWRSTYSSLGWSLSGLPSDSQTVFSISTSSLKWMSERLQTIHGLKLHSSKQLVLSLQGSPIQSYWLGTDLPASQLQEPCRRFQLADPPLVCKATVDSELALFSRFGMDAKVLAPSFSFGYRLERSKVFNRFVDGNPTYHERSNYQPWFVYNTASNIVDPPVGYLGSMDRPFSFGSGGFLNTRRFGTHELKRSTGLDAAVILSDTR